MDRDQAARLAARKAWGSDSLEFDEGAKVSHLDEEGASFGCAWVQAWVFVDRWQIDDEIKGEG
jgi:hypothetical protein